MKKIYYCLSIFLLIVCNGYAQTVTTITTTGTWVCPAGVTSVQVECWGGGGAGGSAVGTAAPTSYRARAGGGAGGAYAKANSITVVPGTSYTVTIGAGGVSSASNGVAVPGGDTWFSTNTTVIAKGGAGANSLVCSSSDLLSSGGVGTTSGSIGDVVYKGGDGATGVASGASTGNGGGGGSSGGTASNGNSASGATGGIAVVGGGVGGNGPTSGGNPGNAPSSGNGGGGGGAFAAASTSVRAGGSGKSGKIVLTYSAVKAEPTNQAGSFGCGTTTINTIPLTWVDAAGAVTPDGYLIKWSNTSYGAITAPTDGIPEADGAGVKNIAQGVQVGTATGLSAGTTYYIQIWSYSNSGASINYNLVSPAQTTCATLTPSPEINIKGNGTSIVDGDPSPATADFTDFGSVGIGATFTRTYTIENTGTATLNISSIVFTGTNASEFTVTTPPASTVAAVSSTTFVVTFAPTASGTRTATITINNDDVDEGAYDFAIKGTATYGALGTVTAVVSSEATTISSLQNDAAVLTTSNGVQTWQFTILDDGVSPTIDNGATIVNQIVLTAGTGNQIDNFADAIQDIALFDAGGTKLATGVVTSTSITFSGMSYSIADNASATFSIRLSLQTDINTSGTNTSGNLDGDDFVFKIATGAITTSAGGSGILSTSTASSTNGKNVIDVTATRLTFKTDASNTVINTNMSPSVKVSPTDANGNIDLTPAGSISIISSGTLVSSPKTATLTSGIATFASISHSAIGTALNLTASIGALNGTSASFNITTSAGSTFGQGDIAVIAVNTSTADLYAQYGKSLGDDEFSFISFNDITTGTSIDFTDNGYERAAVGKWGTGEGFIRLTYTGGTTIAKGTPITVFGNGNATADFIIYTCGTEDANWTVSNQSSGSGDYFNLNTTSDQLWAFQNGAWSNTTGNNATYSGTVCFGWTGDGWKSNIGTTAPTWTSQGSRIVSKMECFVINLNGKSNNYKGKYIGPMTSAAKFDWIKRLNNPSYWMGYTTTSAYEAANETTYATTTQKYETTCITFPISSNTATAGLWTGATGIDWFDCSNWDNKFVPDSTVDVTINNVTNLPTIDVVGSPYASSYYSSLASAKNLDVNSAGSLTLNSTTTNALLVKGNLSINGGTLNTAAGTVELRSDYSIAAGSSISPASATFKFTGSSAQAINNVAGVSPLFYNLLINHTGTGVTLNNSVAVSNGLTISQGLLDAQTNALTGGANVTMTGGTLELGNNGVTQPELTGTYSLTGGTVILKGTGVQTVRAVNYYNLTSTGVGGTRILPNSGTVGIASVLTPGTNVYTVTGSTVNFNGSGNQSIPGLTTAAMSPYVKQYNILKTSTGGIKTVASDFTILDNIEVGNSTTLDLGNTNNWVTIKSDATSTARVAPLLGTAAITYSGTGKFNIERYLPMDINPNSRRWRLLTAPLKSSGAPTLNTAWQEGKVTTIRTSPVQGDIGEGYGTSITRNTSSSQGFDQGSTNNPSVYVCDCGNASTGSWIVPNATNAGLITDNQGYMIFVRGDRSIITSNQYINAKPTNLRAQGQINTGPVGVTLFTTANTNHIIGNPYPSQIDMHNVRLNTVPFGTSGTYWRWDPKLLGSKNVGGWVSFTKVGANIIASTTSGSSYASNGLIESGEAFLVQSAAGSINFAETDKATSSTTVGIASRPLVAPANNYALLRTDLAFVFADGTTGPADGVATAFGVGMSNEVNANDAPAVKTFSTTEKISLVRKDSLLSIETRQAINETDTVFYRIDKLNNAASYQLNFSGRDFDPGLIAILKDDFTKTSQLINVKTDNYKFSTTADPTSYTSARFMLVFKSIAKYTSINGKVQNEDIALNWSVADETYINNYEIQRSEDGVNFSTINTTNVDGTKGYGFMDVKPTSGKDYYYRIKANGINNTFVYSDIIKVRLMHTDGVAQIYIFPNPIKDDNIGLQFNEQPAGLYNVRLINNVGQVLRKETINHAGGTESYSMKAKGAKLISSNSYYIEVINTENVKNTYKVILSK